MEIIASTHAPVPMGSVCAAQSHTIFRLVPALADNSFLDPAVRSQPLENPMPSLKDEQLMPRLTVRDKKKIEGKSEVKDHKAKPTAKSGDVDFDQEGFLCGGLSQTLVEGVSN